MLAFKEEEEPVSCPMCGGPLREHEELYIEDDVIFYKGELVGMARQAHVMLAHLIKRQGKILNKDRMWHHLYGDRPDGGPNLPILNIYMSQIRKAIKRHNLPFTIQTIWSVGWILRRNGEKGDVSEVLPTPTKN
jgi:DNA-binding response OmpR family regulator